MEQLPHYQLDERFPELVLLKLVEVLHLLVELVEVVHRLVELVVLIHHLVVSPLFLRRWNGRAELAPLPISIIGCVNASNGERIGLAE